MRAFLLVDRSIQLATTRDELASGRSSNRCITPMVFFLHGDVVLSGLTLGDNLKALAH